LIIFDLPLPSRSRRRDRERRCLCASRASAEQLRAFALDCLLATAFGPRRSKADMARARPLRTTAQSTRAVPGYTQRSRRLFGTTSGLLDRSIQRRASAWNRRASYLRRRSSEPMFREQSREQNERNWEAPTSGRPHETGPPRPSDTTSLALGAGRSNPVSPMKSRRFRTLKLAANAGESRENTGVLGRPFSSVPGRRDRNGPQERRCGPIRGPSASPDPAGQAHGVRVA
jgi:hypothetical protein